MTAPPTGLWPSIYSAAEGFRQLAPWGWMLDRAVFGVQPPNGEVAYGTMQGISTTF